MQICGGFYFVSIKVSVIWVNLPRIYLITHGEIIANFASVKL